MRPLRRSKDVQIPGKNAASVWNAASLRAKLTEAATANAGKIHRAALAWMLLITIGPRSAYVATRECRVLRNVSVQAHKVCREQEKDGLCLTSFSIRFA